MKRLFKHVFHAGKLVDRMGQRFGDSVLLTFDDGPHPETTPAVLNLLKAHGARAIFFVVGNRIHRAPDLLRRIVDEGHVLGNHSYIHDLSAMTTVRSYLDDLLKCQDEVFRTAGVRPHVHRPPLGVVSLPSVLATRAMKMRTVLWSRSSEDWRFRCDEEADACANTLMSEVRPRDILLFHDERRHTIRLLDLLLPALKSAGYKLDPCIELALKLKS